jgi:queuine tRNA-ribosyltransferase
MNSGFSYEIVAEDKFTNARAGILHTPHGSIDTPTFMPVGTQATVKTLDQEDLQQTNSQVILGNAYHLYLRPGHELIDRAGGLHKFMNWQHPILTDSGGFQVFSLKELNSVEEEGVTFRSHLDGSTHLFSPEIVMEIEHGIGADIIMAFDECTPYPCEYQYAKQSMEMTLRWAKRCKQRHEILSEKRKHRPLQALFGIVQGSIFPDLRIHCANELTSMELPGYAIGGLAVGEPRYNMMEIVAETLPHMPTEKPRYLMGVGLPHDMVESVGLGIDMFDCVVPTRNARNGTAFTKSGRIRLKNAKYSENSQPIDETCQCKTCQNYSRSYLRHLFQTGEYLGLHLTSFHNIFFYNQIMHEAREAIIAGNFKLWQNQFLSSYKDR